MVKLLCGCHGYMAALFRMLSIALKGSHQHNQNPTEKTLLMFFLRLIELHFFLRLLESML